MEGFEKRSLAPPSSWEKIMLYKLCVMHCFSNGKKYLVLCLSAGKKIGTDPLQKSNGGPWLKNGLKLIKQKICELLPKNTTGRSINTFYYNYIKHQNQPSLWIIFYIIQNVILKNPAKAILLVK